MLAGGLDREDAWQRAVEFLFERLAVSWTIAGLEITRQKELLGRYRMASQAGAPVRPRRAARAPGRALPGAGGAVSPTPTAFAALLCDWCLERAARASRCSSARTTLAEPLVRALHRAMLEREAWPLLRLAPPWLAERLLPPRARSASSTASPRSSWPRREASDARRSAIDAPANTRALAGRRSRADRPRRAGRAGRSRRRGCARAGAGRCGRRRRSPSRPG